MTSALKSLTPELYDDLTVREQQRVDRLYERRWASKVPALDPLFASMRAYTQAQVGRMMLLGVFAYGGALLIALGGGAAWATVVGALLIVVWVGIAVRTYLRIRLISRYFRGRGVSPRGGPPA